MKKLLIICQLILIFVVIPYISYVQETNLNFIFTELTILSLLVPQLRSNSEFCYKYSQRFFLKFMNPTFYVQSRAKLKLNMQLENMLGIVENSIIRSQKFKISKCVRINNATYNIELISNDHRGLKNKIEIEHDGEFIYIDFINSNVGYRDTERNIDYVVSLTDLISRELNINEYVIGMTLNFPQDNPFLGMFFNSNKNQLSKLSNLNIRINESLTTDVEIEVNRININSRNLMDFSSIAKSYLLFKK